MAALTRSHPRRSSRRRWTRRRRAPSRSPTPTSRSSTSIARSTPSSPRRPTSAREMAKASDARRAKGEAGLLEGVPLAIKDLFCTEGVQTTAARAHPRRLRAPVREHGDHQPVEGGRGHGRQDQPRRVRHGLLEHDQPLRRRREPVEAAGRQPQAGAGRLVGRLGRGGRGLHGAGQHRHRHRRLDPPAGGVLRHRRPEADLWPLLALGRRGLRQLARPAGAVRAHRRGQRAAAAGDGRPRSRRTRPRRRCRCRTSLPPRAIPTSRGSGSASPRSIASRARRPRSWRCGTRAWRC